MENIHERVLHLRDVALGLRKAVQVNSVLAPASYDCAVDSLLALYTECNQVISLAKDKNVGRFLGKYEEAVRALKELRLTADDFEVKGIIGRGHFGEVQVVTEKSTGDVFAMKVMRKAHILQQADAAFFNEERDIMAWASSPWLTSLHYAFQDPTSLYLVMDFHPGGDLLTIMERREGGMSEDETRFYLSEIIVGLRDLHELGFVHRDVKPENVLITRTGHIKLVDFGSAARLGTDGKVLESRLPVGTPEYIAPEVLTSLDKSADYGVGCDWWSLGIIAYELLYASTPFEDESTSKTYANIMNYKDSLCFPNDVSASADVKDLIQGLLTEPSCRLSYGGIKSHQFFQTTNWDDLLSSIPPHVPLVSSADDMSNFDKFEPEKDNLRFPDLSSKNQRSFSGKSLPFVGFTFTRFESDYIDSARMEPVDDGVDQSVFNKLQSSLERVEKELQETKERKASLERECVIYQSQLDDFHRKLEIEKTERRQSDTRALQLLEEVREQGKIAKQLRESEATATEGDLSAVIQQLEQDRAMASKRARRMKEELKQAQAERDTAIKAAVELKNKLTSVKETSRKEIAVLQAKVAKVTEDSLSKSVEMQDRLTEAHEQHQKLVKKVQSAEEAKRKMKYELQQVQMKLDDSSNVGKKSDALVQELEGKVEALRTESEASMQQCNQFRSKIKEVETQLDEINSMREKLQDSEVNLKKELQEVKMELSQASESRDQLRFDKERLQKELTSKNEWVKTQEVAIGKYTASRQFLETKVAELEKVREASNQEMNDNYKAQLEKLAMLEKEKRQLKDRANSLEAQLVLKGRAVKEVEGRLEQTEQKHQENVEGLRSEIRSLQSKLSEVSSTAIQQGEKLREVRRAKRELDQENADLKTTLKNTQKEVEESEKKFQSSLGKLEELVASKKRLSSMEKSNKALEASKEKVIGELERAQNTTRQLEESKKKLELDLRNTKKQFEAQELKSAMLKRSAELLEEELGEAKAAAEEAKANEAKWKTAKDVVLGDLETAEARLDDAYAANDKGKKLRLNAEQRLSEVMSNLEKAAGAHSEEVAALQESLLTQKQLASKFNDRVSELEKDLRLKMLSLKDIQKELDTEKLVSSKVYNEAHSLRQELGKVKAAHMKLLKEVQEREAQLAKSEADRTRVLNEQKSRAEARYIQETRLQATIAQQSKLIDYLHKVGTISPRAKGMEKIKKGLKLGRRKGHDPARDIAEWNKLKGMSNKSGKGVTSSSSMLNVSQSSSSSAGSTHTQPEGVVTSTPLVGAGGHVNPSESMELSTVPASTSSKAVSSRAKKVYITKLGTPVVTSLAARLEDHRGKQSTSITVEPGDSLTGVPSAVSTMTPQTNVQVSASTTGKKRQIEESQDAAQHKFHLKSAGIHKSYVCGSCKEPIKSLQRLVKCSGCQVTCHPACTDKLPDSCVPLINYDIHNVPPLAKRRRKGNEKLPNDHTSSKNEKSDETTKHAPINADLEEGVDSEQPSAKKRKKGDKSSPGMSKKPAKQQKSSKKTRKVGEVGEQDSSSKDVTVADGDLGDSVQTPGATKQHKGRKSQSTETKQQNVSRKNRTSTNESDHVRVKIEEDLDHDVGSLVFCGQEDKLVKMEKVTSLWGKVKTEGWLILTENTLNWYDRDPLGGTRKPAHSCTFGSPEWTLVVLPSINKRSLPYAIPNKQLDESFGIEKIGVSSHEEIIFIARNIQSKIEWVEAIEKVLVSHSHPPQIDVAMSVISGDDQAEFSPTKAKELKAVSIVPLKGGLQRSAIDTLDTPTPPPRRSKRNISSSSRELDLSIRSSMFGSPSETSFI